MKTLLLCLIFIFPSLAFAKEDIDVLFEGGAVWQNRNDSQIAPSTGSRIAIDEFDQGPFFHHRLEGVYQINPKHALRIVYAPLDLTVRGQSPTPLIFNDESFGATTPFHIRYKFNSYRLTYIYSFWGAEEDKLNLGVTAKVRDAVTSVSQASKTSSYKNVGFVPLFYFEWQKKIRADLSLNLTMDAALAPQGRAVDAALKVRKKLGDKTKLGFGLRTLEGGADNDEVFTFSWFTYAVADLTVQL